MTTTLKWCFDCGEAELDMVGIYPASGNRYFCLSCWARHSDYYESESGLEARQRIGRYYAATPD